MLKYVYKTLDVSLNTAFSHTYNHSCISLHTSHPHKEVFSTVCYLSEEYNQKHMWWYNQSEQVWYFYVPPVYPAAGFMLGSSAPAGPPTVTGRIESPTPYTRQKRDIQEACQ